MDPKSPPFWKLCVDLNEYPTKLYILMTPVLPYQEEIQFILKLKRHFSPINWTTWSLSGGNNAVLETAALSIFSFLSVTN